MTIQTRLIEYRDGDTLLEGLLAWDDSITGSRPAVAIAHAWSGRQDFECNKAKKLAEQQMQNQSGEFNYSRAASQLAEAAAQLRTLRKFAARPKK
ncbi:MAG: hypothetical protein LR011_03465 [Verrucomicrobia bacterium]|nr:hypothetical protein [Verrucomicrobiota bacterium]